jgi:hypothetical protein
MNRRRAGLVMILAGLIMGLFCGGALAATVPTAPAKAATSGKAAPAPVSTASSTSTSTTSTTAPAVSLPVPPVFTGDVQAFAVRIEADEPLPVGPGDLPSVSGQVNAQENFSTATTSVDLLGAVVGPKIADPTGDGHQYTQLPQATCVYPSVPNTANQSYPFDGTDQQAVQSETTCASGPSATGQAYAGQIGGGAGVTNPNELQTLGVSSVPLGVQGAVTGHESLGPDPAAGAVRVSADAELNDFSIPGVLHVASVEATGFSQANAKPGGAATSAAVTVSGLTIGGSTISITPAGVQLGSQAPVPVTADGAVVQEFNQAAAAVGCNLTVLSNPATYPQGPLFSRPPLPNRVNPAGTDAGSTGAGALVRCAVPNSLNPTTFNPLIVQIVFGFVGTEANASYDNPGLGIGSLAPPPAGTSTPILPSSSGGLAPAPSGASSISSTLSSGGTGPAVTPTTVSRTTPPTIESVVPTRTLGGLVPIRSTLEAGGLAVALLIALAGVGLLAPWRITLAPVDHPEI